MKISIAQRTGFLCLCMLLGISPIIAQTSPLPDSLEVATLVSEYTIPTAVSALKITTRGADGGDARRDGNCNKRGRGGSGAWTTATFEVGSAGNQLQSGGLLRIYVGQPGGESGRLCASTKKGPWGGGGGSTAVLYLPPGENPVSGRWYILTISGGGGGGAITSDWGVKTSYSGGGGLTGAGDGGAGGNLEAINLGGYGGAGVNADADGFGGKRMNSTAPDADYRVLLKADHLIYDTGGIDPNASDNGIQGGGNGFTGGGASSNSGSGGGGGHSGASGTSGGGTGGGSFITTAISNTNAKKTNGVAGGGTYRSGVAYVIALRQIP